MSGLLFDDVADTAIWVATYRAIESERPDALFRDRFAARLAGERGRRFAREVEGSRNFAWSIVIRTCVIDDLIHEAVAAGIDTVLNLGAGMDARPYRLTLPPSLRWIEVDHPRILDLKEAALAGETPACRLERRPLDLALGDARRALFSSLAGNVLVLTEGVIGYLSNDEVSELARDLHARENFGRWIVDYTSPMLRRAMRRRRRVRQQFQNAPVRFDPPDWERLFASAGWRVSTRRHLVEAGERLGRPVPLPVWLRVLRVLMPKKRKEELRQMMGYALLER